MRNGLRNLSNTFLMRIGAAFGPGIYASATYNTSFGYSSRYNSGGNNFWSNSIENLRDNTNFIIGVVEIINK
jgi:hypothetical protein